MNASIVNKLAREIAHGLDAFEQDTIEAALAEGATENEASAALLEEYERRAMQITLEIKARKA